MRLDDGWQEVHLTRLGASPRYAISFRDRILDVLALETTDGLDVHIGGITYSVATVRQAKGRNKPVEEEDGTFVDGKWSLLSPITGSVVDTRVAVGDSVEQGSVLMIVEAMKMQNELRSRVAGEVTAINAETGQRVETGTVLLEVTEPED